MRYWHLLLLVLLLASCASPLPLAKPSPVSTAPTPPTPPSLSAPKSTFPLTPLPGWEGVFFQGGRLLPQASLSEEVGRLKSLLEDWAGKIDWVSLYVANEFDCSEMSAALGEALERAGFRTYIAEGINLYGWIAQEKHAWVMVEFPDGFVPLEAAIFGFMRGELWHRPQYLFEGAEAGDHFNPGEYDYWNSPQYKASPL